MAVQKSKTSKRKSRIKKIFLNNKIIIKNFMYNNNIKNLCLN
ncbi:MAG: hypothetical protein ACSLEI_00595 [Candidatus Carsonella ruddii]